MNLRLNIKLGKAKYILTLFTTLSSVTLELGGRIAILLLHLEVEWSQCQSCTLGCSVRVPVNESFNKLETYTIKVVAP